MRTPLFLLALLSACSSNTTPGTTTDSGSTVDAAGYDYCAALTERSVKCDAGAPSDCAKQKGCYLAIARPDAADALLHCLAARACGESDDKCVSDLSVPYATDARVTAFVKSCTDKRTSCGDSFPDDYCAGDFGLFKDEIRTQVEACTTKPCAEVATCFEAVYASSGCK